MLPAGPATPPDGDAASCPWARPRTSRSASWVLAGEAAPRPREPSAQLGEEARARPGYAVEGTDLVYRSTGRRYLPSLVVSAGSETGAPPQVAIARISEYFNTVFGPALPKISEDRYYSFLADEKMHTRWTFEEFVEIVDLAHKYGCNMSAVADRLTHRRCSPTSCLEALLLYYRILRPLDQTMMYTQASANRLTLEQLPERTGTLVQDELTYNRSWGRVRPLLTLDGVPVIAHPDPKILNVWGAPRLPGKGEESELWSLGQMPVGVPGGAGEVGGLGGAAGAGWVPDGAGAAGVAAIGGVARPTGSAETQGAAGSVAPWPSSAGDLRTELALRLFRESDEPCPYERPPPAEPPQVKRPYKTPAILSEPAYNAQRNEAAFRYVAAVSKFYDHQRKFLESAVIQERELQARLRYISAAGSPLRVLDHLNAVGGPYPSMARFARERGEWYSRQMAEEHRRPSSPRGMLLGPRSGAHPLSATLVGATPQSEAGKRQDGPLRGTAAGALGPQEFSSEQPGAGSPKGECVSQTPAFVLLSSHTAGAERTPRGCLSRAPGSSGRAYGRVSSKGSKDSESGVAGAGRLAARMDKRAVRSGEHPDSGRFLGSAESPRSVESSGSPGALGILRSLDSSRSSDVREVSSAFAASAVSAASAVFDSAETAGVPTSPELPNPESTNDSTHFTASVLVPGPTADAVDAAGGHLAKPAEPGQSGEGSVQSLAQDLGAGGRGQRPEEWPEAQAQAKTEVEVEAKAAVPSSSFSPSSLRSQLQLQSQSQSQPSPGAPLPASSSVERDGLNRDAETPAGVLGQQVRAKATQQILRQAHAQTPALTNKDLPSHTKGIGDVSTRPRAEPAAAEGDGAPLRMLRLPRAPRLPGANRLSDEAGQVESAQGTPSQAQQSPPGSQSLQTPPRVAAAQYGLLGPGVGGEKRVSGEGAGLNAPESPFALGAGANFFEGEASRAGDGARDAMVRGPAGPGEREDHQISVEDGPFAPHLEDAGREPADDRVNRVVGFSCVSGASGVPAALESPSAGAAELAVSAGPLVQNADDAVARSSLGALGDRSHPGSQPGQPRGGPLDTPGLLNSPDSRDLPKHESPGAEAQQNRIYQYQLMLRTQLARRAGKPAALLRTDAPPVKPSRRRWEGAIREALTAELGEGELERLLGFYGTGTGEFNRQVYSFESERAESVALARPEFFSYLDTLAAEEGQASGRGRDGGGRSSASRDSGPLGRRGPSRDRQPIAAPTAPVGLASGAAAQASSARAAPQPPVSSRAASSAERTGRRAGKAGKGGRAGKGEKAGPAGQAAARQRPGRKPLSYASIMSPAIRPEMSGQELARAVLLNRAVPRGALVDILTPAIIADVRRRNAEAEEKEMRSRGALSFLDVSTEDQSPLCRASLAVPGHLKIPLKSTQAPDTYNKAFNGWYRCAGGTAVFRGGGKSDRMTLSSQAASLWRHTLDIELLPPKLLRGMATVYAQWDRARSAYVASAAWEVREAREAREAPVALTAPTMPPAPTALTAQAEEVPQAAQAVVAQVDTVPGAPAGEVLYPSRQGPRARSTEARTSAPHRYRRQAPWARRDSSQRALWTAFQPSPPTSSDPSGLVASCINLLSAEERKGVVDRRARLLEVSSRLVDWSIDLHRLRQLEAL